MTAAGFPGATVANPIGNLNNEIINNENLYTGTAATNSFKVSADGIYQVNMNVQISTAN
ncbi:hypothetical protein [Chryseobacterium sp. NFX27]|uniref:hypothetical protein n=1 Tax=Chryseobacterium sp. NFX27 TaxID=2819618 RepID=UPI003CF1D499